MEQKWIESKWRGFQIKWQLVVGRAKERGATEEELMKLKEIVPIFKKYNLHIGVIERNDRKEVEG